ncbi:MAG: hypothetical protein V6Z82_04795 [Flavobacteriales bacterium]
MTKKQESERQVARILFVERGSSRKEIAEKLGKSEHTVGLWVVKYGWAAERTARLNSNKAQRRRIEEILEAYADQTLRLLKTLREREKAGDEKACLAINKQLAASGDEVSKWNKRIELLNKNDRPSPAAYLAVMDEIFEALRKHNESLYHKTLDFQEQFLQDRLKNWGT